MLSIIKIYKIALLMVYTVGFFCISLPVKAQDRGLFEDEKIDLWESLPQLPDTENNNQTERYYRPQRDFNQPQPDKPTQANDEKYETQKPGIEKTPLVKDPPQVNEENQIKKIIEDITNKDKEDFKPIKPTLSEIGRYYITNISYGASLGLLIGGIAVMVTEPRFDAAFSYIGTGIIVGMVGGALIALLKSKVLTRPVADTPQTVDIPQTMITPKKSDIHLSTQNYKPNNKHRSVVNRLEFPLFSANF